MRRVAGLLLVALCAVLFHAPAVHAQYPNLPNEAAWNQYLAAHPKTAAELRANPSLIYNPTWRANHPHFEVWANNHKQDWEVLQHPAAWQNRYGAWDDKSHEWHDQDWWYHNNPAWAHENHPDWWQEHKQWNAWPQDQHAEHHEHN
ncbi:MAG: hypothetical protein ACLQAT_30785 [Candidatus Binataceae bacterium]